MEMPVTGPLRPESSNPAMTAAPRKVASVSQYVDGLTHVVRRVPLGGFENMATMNASATGITAEPNRPGGGTGESGTRVKALGIDPRVLRGGELVRDRGHNVTGSVAQHPDHQEALDRTVDHQALQVARALDRPSVDLDDDVAGAEARGLGGAPLDDLDNLETFAAADFPGPARRDRTRDPGDAEVRAPDAPVADQGADDPLGGRVDRNGKTEAGARERGVDPDHAPRRI